MVSINYGYGITRKFLEEAGHDELLLKHLDRLSQQSKMSYQNILLKQCVKKL